MNRPGINLSEYRQIRQMLADIHPNPDALQRMVPSDTQQEALDRLRRELRRIFCGCTPVTRPANRP